MSQTLSAKYSFLDPASYAGNAAWRRFCAAVLVMGFLHSALYVFLSPPWQHYDEPSHFEYAALIARTGRLTHEQQPDPILKRQIMVSMARNGFYGKASSLEFVNLLSDAALDLGYAQFRHPPLYYAMAALPIRILEGTPVEVQLRAARFVSVALFLVMIACALYFVRIIAPQGHPIQIVLPLGVALFPTLAELLSALNSDALAAASGSLVIALSVGVIKHGRLTHLLGLLIACGLAWLSKDSARLLLPAAALAVLLRLFRAVHWGWILGAVCACILGMGTSVTRLGDPASWYRTATSTIPMRCSSTTCATENENASSAFMLPSSARGAASSALLQVMTSEAVQELRGHTLEVSARIWAKSSISATLPVLKAYEAQNPLPIVNKSVAAKIQSQSATYTFTVSVPITTWHITLMLIGSPDGDVYFDQVSLRRATANAKDQVRNPSAAATWPWLIPTVQGPLLRLLPDAPAFNFLMLPFDGSIARQHVAFAFETAFITFWARFGWAHYGVPAPADVVLKVLSALSLIVLFITARRWLKWLGGPLALFLVAAFCCVWVITLLRSVSYLDISTIWIMVVWRYGAPVMLCALFLLNVGWTELLSRGGGRTVVVALILSQLIWALICAASVLYAARLVLYM